MQIELVEALDADRTILQLYLYDPWEFDDSDVAAALTDDPWQYAQMTSERLEVQQTIAAHPATIFRLLCDPQGHVTIGGSGMH
jgi:hypothetical protein